MRNKGNKIKPNKKELVFEALLRAYGNISQACNSIGIAGKTYYEWLKQDPDFANQARAAIEEGQRLRLDRAEFVQAKLLDSKDEAMRLKTSMYVLNNLGKKRGYNVPELPPEEVKAPDLSRLDIDELILYKKLQAKAEGNDSD